MTERTARLWREASGDDGTTWTWRLNYVNDGDDLVLPPEAVIEETHHDTGRLAVWWREPTHTEGSDDGDD